MFLTRNMKFGYCQSLRFMLDIVHYSFFKGLNFILTFVLLKKYFLEKCI